MTRFPKHGSVLQWLHYLAPYIIGVGLIVAAVLYRCFSSPPINSREEDSSSENNRENTA